MRKTSKLDLPTEMRWYIEVFKVLTAEFCRLANCRQFIFPPPNGGCSNAGQ